MTAKEAAKRDNAKHSHTLNMVWTLDGRHVCAHCGVEPFPRKKEAESK